MIATRQDFDKTQTCGRKARALRTVGRWISTEPSHGREVPAMEEPAP